MKLLRLQLAHASLLSSRSLSLSLEGPSCNLWQFWCRISNQLSDVKSLHWTSKPHVCSLGLSFFLKVLWLCFRAHLKPMCWKLWGPWVLMDCGGSPLKSCDKPLDYRGFFIQKDFGTRPGPFCIPRYPKSSSHPHLVFALVRWSLKTVVFAWALAAQWWTRTTSLARCLGWMDWWVVPLRWNGCDFQNGGFHQWGYPNSWMVYDGKSH